MTIRAVVQPYEILIRFTDGLVSGAHYKTIEVVTDGERVYSATEGLPMPVEGDAVADVLGEALQGSLLRIGELEQQLVALSSETEALIAARNELLLQLNALQQPAEAPAAAL